MIEHNKVRLSKEEWAKFQQDNPELAEYARIQEASDKPTEEEKGIEIDDPLLIEDEPFMLKWHELRRWQLLVLITLSTVGLGFLGWQIYTHWQLTLIILAFIGITIWAIILRRRDNE